MESFCRTRFSMDDAVFQVGWYGLLYMSRSQYSASNVIGPYYLCLAVVDCHGIFFRYLHSSRYALNARDGSHQSYFSCFHWQRLRKISLNKQYQLSPSGWRWNILSTFSPWNIGKNFRSSSSVCHWIVVSAVCTGVMNLSLWSHSSRFFNFVRSSTPES